MSDLIAWATFSEEKSFVPFENVLNSSMNFKSLNILRADLIYLASLAAITTFGFLEKLQNLKSGHFTKQNGAKFKAISYQNLLFMVLQDKLLKVWVKEVVRVDIAAYVIDTMGWISDFTVTGSKKVEVWEVTLNVDESL